MSVHMTESEIYGSVWGTDEVREIFDDRPRTEAWCRLIGTLADAQAELNIIPDRAAREIQRVCSNPELSMEALKKGYDENGHSTLGLIRHLKKQCNGRAGEWLYYGATVQDITDTWMMQALNQVWKIVKRDCEEIRDQMMILAAEHKTTTMAGRTHGQIGSPITLGFKISVWIDEMGRHLQRLKELKTRINVGQLSGALGGLTAFGELGYTLRQEFFDRLELEPAAIAWINSRDRQAEFTNVLSMIASTLEKIGQEVYNLQRTEINEIQESFEEGQVSSITMPHKRNPELSEQLGTLARLIRANHKTLLDSLIHDHERDGRSWKLEWEALPAICLATGAILKLSLKLLQNLEINESEMESNIADQGGMVFSERLMIRLAEEVGKQTAHKIVYDLAIDARDSEQTFWELISKSERVLEHLEEDELRRIFSGDESLGIAEAAVERILDKYE